MMRNACLVFLGTWVAFAQQKPEIPLGLDALLPTPEDNPLTVEKVALGRKLFFDRRLSRNGTIACASCHEPGMAFADSKPVAVGVEGRKGSRRSPRILNRAYGKSFFWDGRAGSLEQQVGEPIENRLEMDLSVPEAAARVDLDETSLRQALASYVRTILSGDSPYDRYVAGDRDALTAEAQSGLKIFRGKGGCVVCHLGPNLTDERFHNTGIGNNDPGRAKVTGRAEDAGAFKTPSLREVAAAAPYMHDGSVATLEDVIEHYNKGGVKNPQLDPELHELKLSDSDKRALVAFLRSLSGTVREGPWMQAYQPADYRELVPLYEQAVSARRTAGDPKLAGSMRDLGMFLLRNGDAQGAELWLRRALALDGLPAGREQLASALEAGGKLTDAAALYEEAAKASELAARCLAKLGELAQARGDKAGALEFYKRALAVSNGPHLAARLNDAGLLLKDLKKYTEADSHFRRALAIQEKSLGASHPEVAATLNNLATLSFDRDRIVEAEQLQRRSLGILESALGKSHVRVGVSASNLADILRAKGDDVAARRYYAQALAIFDEALGPSHHWTVEARDALAGK